jgi:hypothetical protein
VDTDTVAQHALERAQRGLDAWRRGAVGRRSGDEYVVAGSHGTLYVVHLGDEPETCTCKDAAVRGETCKHVYASVVERAKTSAAAAR